MFFNLKFWLGLGMVSTTDLDVKGWKSAHNLITLLLFPLVQVMYWSHMTELRNLTQFLIHDMIYTCVVLYHIGKSTLDYRTEIVSALNLIELDSWFGTYDNSLVMEGLLLCLVLSDILALAVKLPFLLLLSKSFSIVLILRTVYKNVFKTLLAFGLTLMTLNCYHIRIAMRNNLENLSNTLIKERLPETHRRARHAWTLKIRQQMQLLVDGQRELFYVEAHLRSWYLAFVIGFTIIAATSTSFLVNFFIQSSKYILKLGYISAFFYYPLFVLVLVVLSEIADADKNELHQQMLTLRQKTNRKDIHNNVKLCILASKHRNSGFTCYLFDVNYNLLEEIINSCVLVLMSLQ